MSDTETDIITDVLEVELDAAVPQTTAQPRFYRVHTQTNQGPFDIRIAQSALPKLAAHLDKVWSGGQVVFLGQGPFDLPVSQSSTAEAGTDAVTVTFRVLVNPSRVGAVRIAVPNNQALELAQAIVSAAAAKA